MTLALLTNYHRGDWAGELNPANYPMLFTRKQLRSWVRPGKVVQG